MESYLVVPQMKALDECFPDQFRFGRYDIIWWCNGVQSFFFKRIKNAPAHHLSKCVPEDGDLSQCMHEWGRAFARYFSLWVTWFFFSMYSVLFSIFLALQTLHPNDISCVGVHQWQSSNRCYHVKIAVKVQGHLIYKRRCQQNPYFWVALIRSTPNLVWK
jgi:hypothetical protein